MKSIVLREQKHTQFYLLNLNNILKFSEKNIWVLTDGSKGMISQANGLAKFFSNKITFIETKLIFPWSFLQPGFLPIYKWIFKNKIIKNCKPDIVISCGRKSVYLSIYLKKIFLKDIITIHIQNPKIKLNKFDYIVAPNHDNINGDNVIKSIGAIHHFTKENIKQNNENFSIPKENLISIIIGGKNRHYYFTEKVINDLIKKIQNLKKNYSKFNFLIIGSRRTGQYITDILQKKLNNIAHVWNGNDENPYVFALNYSKFFIITSDSTSMISECAFTNKPIFVYKGESIL